MRPFVFAVFSVVLAITTWIPADADGAESWNWHHPYPVGHDLNDIWGSGSSDIFAAGDSGTILHFDGRQWSLMPSGTSRDLSSVHGNGPKDVYAVGDKGTVLHFDGKHWSQISSPQQVNSIDQVLCLGKKEVFVRTALSIYLFDGKDWKKIRESSGFDMWGFKSGELYVVYRKHLKRFDGSSWAVIDGIEGRKIYGTSSSDIYVVGDSASHFNGHSWEEFGRYIEAVDVWADRGSGLLVLQDGRHLPKYGDDFSSNDLQRQAPRPGEPALAGNPPIPWPMNALWGADRNDVYAVGVAGMLVHFDGFTWTEVSIRAGSQLRDYLEGIWGFGPDDVYAFGGTLGILHYDGEQWAQQLDHRKAWRDRILGRAVSEENRYKLVIRGLWGCEPSQVWAVGSNGLILQWNGFEWTVFDSPVRRDLKAIWGSSCDNVIAVGDMGTALHFDGTVWESVESGTEISLTAVWGSSPNNVITTGLRGDDSSFRRWDGTTWSAMDGRWWTDFEAIWGSSEHDVFAVGSNGFIVHYDGTQWAEMQSGTSEDLIAVWGTGSDDVYAAGERGSGNEITILHYDGQSWSPMDAGHGDYAIRGLWGSSTDDV